MLAWGEMHIKRWKDMVGNEMMSEKTWENGKLLKCFKVCLPTGQDIYENVIVLLG